jgi:hypothetical protein
MSAAIEILSGHLPRNALDCRGFDCLLTVTLNLMDEMQHCA